MNSEKGEKEQFCGTEMNMRGGIKKREWTYSNRLFSISFVICLLLFTGVGIASAAGEEDGVSTYKSTDFSSAGSVFGDGETVYIMAMDWVQTVGGSSTVSITNGVETVSMNIYDDGTSPDTKANDGHYWGVFTIGTDSTNDTTDYLHLDDGNEATITADIGNDGTSGAFNILAYYNTNPTKITVQPGDSIQEAIDNLPAEGGIVELAPGEHWVNTNETIMVNKSNVTIQGSCSAIVKHNTTITARDEAESCFRVPKDGYQNIVFKGFNTTSTYTYSFCSIISAEGVTHFTVEDIYDTSHAFFLAGAGSSAADVHYSNNVYFKNITTTTGRPHLGATFSNHVFFIDNNIDGTQGIDMNRNNKFIYVYNNLVTSGQNGMRIHGGQTNYEIWNNTFYDCTFDGVLLDDGSYNGIIRNNIITGVPASRGGAGVWITPQNQHQNIVLKNNIIYNNDVPGVLTGNYTRHVEPMPISNVTFINNVIYNNAGDGVSMPSPYVDLVLKNNIIVNNSGYGINSSAGGLTLSYNDVWNNGDGNYSGTTAGTGGISEDPLFADAENNDFHLKSTEGRWTESGWITDVGDSPCIYLGDPTDDYSNEPAPNGGRINMGAYGNTEEASKSPGAATGTISGNVTDSNGTAIINATVTDGTLFATTNETGGYTIEDVFMGNYTFIASADGYNKASKNVTVENQTTVVNFQLTANITNVYIWLEAESADTLTPDFETSNDASASSGEYIWVPEGTGWNPRKGEATYTIHINTSGDYVIWGTTLASTGGNNSFFVQLDESFEALWTINLSDNWQWDAVNHWGNGSEFNPEIDPVVFTLAAGDHTLRIKQREDGTKLDRLLITNNMSYVPPYIDSVPPGTNVTISPPQDESGWNDVTPVALTFFRSDSGSGIAYTNYSKTSETGPWTTVNTATATGTDAGNVTDITEGGFNVTVSDEGITQVWYYSVDLNSNVETTKDVTVKIPHITSVTIQSPNDVTDNRLRESSPDTVLGSTDFIDVGRIGSTGNYRDVIWFNLSQLNSTDLIKSAKLSLFWYYESRDKSTTVEIYRPMDWAENYVTWNNRTNGVAWDNLGGDWYDTNIVAQGNTPYAAVTFPVGTPDNEYHEFDVTELVQSYVDGTYDNTGFFIKANEVSDGYIAFRSSDGADANERPKLVVSYGNGDAQQNALSGAVTGPDSVTGIAGATVTLATVEGAEINTTQTDSTGHYAFTGVSPGYYNLTATKHGYWPDSDPVTVTAEELTTADVMLCMIYDFNTNSGPADAGDLVMMEDATVNAITPDWTYDLNGNGELADASDLAMLKDASVAGVDGLE